MRDALASSVNTWLSAIRRAISTAAQEGHLQAQVDAEQMAFEIHALILALHYEVRFLRSPDSVSRALRAFESIVARYAQAAPDASINPSSELTRTPRSRKKPSAVVQH